MQPESYEVMAAQLSAIALNAAQQGPQKLVVSSQVGAVWPNRGNSFWLSLRNATWYLSTWLPALYKVPSDQDMVALCRECMSFGSGAMYTVPEHIAHQFGLVRVDDEYEKLFPGD
jgi:hypothetical protein